MGQNKREKGIWVGAHTKISKLQNMERKQIKQASCSLQFYTDAGS